MHLVRRLALSAPLTLLAALASVPALSGCAVRASPPVVGGYATVYADGVPADIYAYPHVWYDGGYAYLVNDRWYYPYGGGWVVLRHEPAELYGYRRDYRAPEYGRTVRQPPAPVYRETAPRGYRQVAPPARPQSAPPANRNTTPPRPERER
jgi:hypothetical protein